MRQRLSDVNGAISWGNFAKEYFMLSPMAFYHKMNGSDGKGGRGGFTPAEAEQMRGALIDLAERIRRAAEKL